MPTNLSLHLVSETAKTITLGWTPPPAVKWYTFHAAGKQVSNAPAVDRNGVVKHTVKFAKAPPYKVVALSLLAEGVYPAVSPSAPHLLGASWRR